MGRRRFFVALVATATFSVAPLQQSDAQPPVQPGDVTGPGMGRGNGPMLGPARQRWREMSPLDRQRFKSNAERWLQMPPEERDALRSRENLRRQRIKRAAEAALQESGLQLEAEKRELYERRYMQERRRVERALRQELQERRRREMQPVVERLKREFGQGQSPVAPSISTEPNASPSK